MISVAETRKKFDEDPDAWRIPLMDFVDDFRFYRDVTAIEQPFELGDVEKDAVFAGVIETLCDELDIPIPEWLLQVPACKQPLFLSRMESLKATAIVQSPVRFRLRKVFVHENFLSRV
ncbi:MAG: hypothetical protein KBF83_14750 [Pyrinomonadaceae bacterium]|nr:hypothetical protein [Pyrinomonadaceae bacterium]